MRPILLLSFLAFWTPVAWAGDAEAMARFLSAPELPQRLIAAATRSSVMQENPCPTAEYRVATKPLIVVPMQFSDQGVPTAGVLHFPVLMKGCAAERRLNVYVITEAAGKGNIVSYLPGTTHADRQLQKDGALQAFAAAGKPEENCKSWYVADTLYLGPDGDALPGAAGVPWRERWTIAGCHEQRVVPMKFIPDKTGTTIAAGPLNSVETLPLVHPAP